MVKLNEVKGLVVKATGRTGLVLKKYSPEILMGVGIVGIIGSTVMACKATLKVEEVVDEAKETLDKIHKAHDDENITEEIYSEQDYKKDLVITYTQTGVKFIKLYGPAVTLGAASIGCLLGAHGILKKRNVALMAAYKAVEQSFGDYRQRVREELGEEKDRRYHLGLKEETVTEETVDANGKKKKVKKTVEVVDPNKISQYARFFDDSSSQWSNVPEHNLVFLKAQQNFANDLLNSRGHVFLNEVYDMLGIPRSSAGAIVGWVKGEGDDFVDFGIFNRDDEKVRDFVNGYETNIMLDFNVTGVIYDLI